MDNEKKAKILDYMKDHAETLLKGKVKDIMNYSAEQIILAKYDSTQFMKAYNEAKRRLDN